MVRYLARRLFWTAMTFFAVTVLTFTLFFVVPSDPARLYAPSDDPASVLRTRHQLALDHPLYVQYVVDMKHVLVDHDFGYSYANRQRVTTLLLNAAPVTAALVLGGLALATLTSLTLGVISALHPRSAVDRSAMVFVLVGISAHPLWLGLILSWLFGAQLGWLPLAGYCDLHMTPTSLCGGATAWATHMILPWVTFAALYAALYSRMIRSCLLEALHEDYVLTAVAKGVSPGGVVRHHAMRNALLPVVTMLGMDIGICLANCAFVERVFGLPGVGGLAVSSATGRDLPLLLAIVVSTTIVILIAGLIVDGLYLVLDPRVRLA